MPGTQTKRLFLGDIWLGSVKAAKQVALSGNHAIMVVKTNHDRFPKAWLCEQMEDLPGGTWILLEGRTKKEVDLLSIGYKYNSSAVLTFIVTKGAGSTVASRPYKARFPDVYGNVHACNVPRPEVLNKYFNHCNAVDGHNQLRQGHLALKKCWVTVDPFFRILSTLVGMQVTDLLQLHRKFKSRTLVKMPINTFADRIAFALQQKAHALLQEEIGARQEEKKLQSEQYGRNLQICAE